MMRKITIKILIPLESYTPYGVLVKNTGVCQEYATAFKLLLNRLGMECIVVSSEGMNHAWNIVKIDGDYYHVDVTWDDPIPDRKNQTSYKYFNLSDKKMGEDHYWDRSNYPSCTSEKYAYFSDIHYTIVGDYLYYSSKTNDRLYKIKADGTNKTQITKDRALFPVVHGDWIYFSDYSYGGYLFKIRKDGTAQTQLNDSHSVNLYIENEIL